MFETLSIFTLYLMNFYIYIFMILQRHSQFEINKSPPSILSIQTIYIAINLKIYELFGFNSKQTQKKKKEANKPVGDVASRSESSAASMAIKP